MEENGYSVDIKDTLDLNAIKQQYQVPDALQSCHTAIVDGYIIEGHVPVADIDRLLSQRPKIIGLAVPGMPIGSPGMEVPGSPAEPFDVYAFDTAGNWEIFAQYTP